MRHRLGPTGSRRGPALILLALPLLLAGCLAGPGGGSYSLEIAGGDPVAALQRINRAGARCWPGAAETGLRDLHLVPELDTRAGRPRLLLLEKGEAEGLPVLVIEAGGSPDTITAYGPLSGTSAGRRVKTDIARWSRGSLTCRGEG